MAGGISSSEQQYEEEHEQYLYKEAHTIAVELGYAGSWDQFMNDYLKMITDHNLKMRIGK